MELHDAGTILPTRFTAVHAAPAPPPTLPPRPLGDLTGADIADIEQAVRAVWPGCEDAQRRRARGARFLLQHLEAFPGQTWQQRWEASGLDEPGHPVGAVTHHRRERDETTVGTACLFVLRVIQPSLRALRSTRFLGYGERFLTAQGDPLLEQFWMAVQGVAVHPSYHVGALFDIAVALTTQGIALGDLTPETFLHYVWESRDHGLSFKGRARHNRGQFPGRLAWQVLHAIGHFPSGTAPTLRAAVLSGRWTIAQLVDRYGIRHQGMRQLLIDYLERRKPELDYSSLDQLSRKLAGLFWSKIEKLAPEQADLRLDVELYERWRDALRSRDDGRGQRVDTERVLLSVRSLYTDLHTWPVEEPQKWASWVAPCPVSESELRGFNVRQRRTKERIDDRVRQRQPLLPTLDSDASPPSRPRCVGLVQRRRGGGFCGGGDL